ncbi:MAG: AbrB/MazE/SpoVT family DNA-binding domain-containing protein [Candidatus Diapherotrites archaeon]|uniref:AbrB/MazE/SpoVT family DNA-binding domain-containing protein n=1 Tax=Candidatus Iainarchaeum sp. TaxID=3101447 RepID=A0A938YYB7_9ARCH|nr:AbrB/MazE/SpoVT family DNA-binding domain-containing protein [Candidatus Diapherotrites archaeon]
MKKAKEPYSFAGKKLGEFEAEKCPKCKEVFFTEGASDQIDKRAKELGLWGLRQEGKLGYSGNSLIVRVPKKIAEFLNLKQGQRVSIHPEGKDKLVIEA